MKGPNRLVMYTAAIAVALAGLCVLALANNASRRELLCRGVNVNIAEKYHFVTEDDVREFIMRGYGECEGMKLDSIELHRIEEHVRAQSAIRGCEAYITDDGYLNVDIVQREPVVRFQKDGYGFYADCEGFIFPLQDNYTSLVPIVDGEVPITEEKGFKGAPTDENQSRWLKDVIRMVEYMQTHVNWADVVVQMHVNQKGDLVLVPREGRERFIFGAPDELDEKFERISQYYAFIRNSRDDDYYSSVNVKFKGQIVCKK